MDELKVIKELLAKVAFVSPGDIEGDTKLFDDLNIDSLALIESFVELDKALGVRLDPTIFNRDQINTPEKLLILIQKARAGNGIL